MLIDMLYLDCMGMLFSELAANYLIEHIIHHPMHPREDSFASFFPTETSAVSAKKLSRKARSAPGHSGDMSMWDHDGPGNLVVGLKFTAWTCFLEEETYITNILELIWAVHSHTVLK